MSDDFTKRIKMRGSLWSLGVGLALGIAAYVWGGLHLTPEQKALSLCERRELKPYDDQGMVTPRAAILAASAKCEREVRLKFATKP